RYRVAGLGSRLAAGLLEFGLWGVPAGPGGVGGIGPGVVGRGRGGGGVPGVLLGVVGLRWGYFLGFEWLWRGQTPGKRLAGVRVVRLDGTGIGLVEAAVRNVVRLVESLTMAAGVSLRG